MCINTSSCLFKSYQPHFSLEIVATCSSHLCNDQLFVGLDEPHHVRPGIPYLLPAQWTSRLPHRAHLFKLRQSLSKLSLMVIFFSNPLRTGTVKHHKKDLQKKWTEKIKAYKKDKPKFLLSDSTDIGLLSQNAINVSKHFPFLCLSWITLWAVLCYSIGQPRT